jgi:hypothetical protein
MSLSDDASVKKWNCSKCRGEGFEDGDKYREFRNCDSSKNENIAWEWMPELRRCPWSQTDDETWEAIRWWGEFKEFGVLPWGGSDLMEQPAFVLEVFNLCTEIKNVFQGEQAKKEKSQWQKTAKSGSR